MKKQQILLLDFLFISILIFLLGFSYLSYDRIEKLKSASDWVNHSNLVKLSLNRTFIHVVDAESGQRGYLLTHDKTFLNQYNDAFTKTNDDVSKIISLTADNKDQQQNAQKLEVIIKSRLEILHAILVYSNDKNYNTDGLKLLLLKGKAIMDSTRALGFQISKTEDKLLESRKKEKAHASSITPIFILLFSIFSIIFVIIAYVKMRTETTLRMHAQDSEASSRKLQQESAEMNVLLESKVSERTQELQQKNITLENMNDELLSFNYVASHDLQEPLRKIQAFSNRIIDSDEKFSEKTKDYFSRITSAAARMQKLLEALISYSRAGNIDQDYVSTDLNLLLEEIKSDIHETIEEKKASITTAKLPTLDVIPLQFHQLFLNLISNAIKYSKPNIPPEINITAAIINVDEIEKNVSLHHKSYWKIAFTDNGIGFEKEYEDKIFELFQRLHGKNEFEGTGIGLAICKKIVQNHNGYIFAEGSLGVGATFFIYFPS